MGSIDNLNSSVLGEIYARLRALETAPAATNTAIGRAGMEVYDGGVIDITNGGLNVTGTATISGTLTGSGTFTWSGPFNQSGVSTFTGNVNLNGPTDIAGDLDVTGPTTITGTLSVEGVTTLKSDLNVTAGGKIKAGVTQISPDGTIAFGSGLQITPDNGSGQAAIMAGASQIILTPPTGHSSLAGRTSRASSLRWPSSSIRCPRPRKRPTCTLLWTALLAVRSSR